MSTYKDAGVDVKAGEETVERIKPLVRKTFTERQAFLLAFPFLL